MPRDGIKLAQDKSLRTFDHDGRLHVAASNISKATVNPYRGEEIPDYEALGLDPQKIYWLLRDPEELAKAAPTFNNIPILDRHVPVHADEPQKEFVVGSTGTDSNFNGKFLSNSLVIWDSVAIAGIETKVQRELSSAYRYDADMTPGNFAGASYDGIMRNIRGNHVALVEVGRAGPDVVVGDSKLSEKVIMKLSAKAIAVRGAIKAFLSGKIAQDAQIGDLTAIVGKVNSASYAKDKAGIAAAVKKEFTPKLAQDMEIDAAELVQILDAVDDNDVIDSSAVTPDPEKPGMDSTPSEELMSLLKGAGLSDEVLQQISVLVSQMGAPGASDAAVDPKKDGKKDDGKVGKPAMDAAIQLAVKRAESATVARMQAIAQAEKDVAPLIGSVAAMDSAAAVYKLALDHAKIDVQGVDPSAFRAMVGMLKAKADSAANASKARFAQDAATGNGFADVFPKAGKMKGGV